MFGVTKKEKNELIAKPFMYSVSFTSVKVDKDCQG